MGIYLLRGAGAGVNGVAEDVRSICNYRFTLRIDALGGYGGDVVTIQESPDGGTTWNNVGTLTSGQQLVLAEPYDLVRANTGASLTGTATVIAEVSG